MGSGIDIGDPATLFGSGSFTAELFFRADDPHVALTGAWVDVRLISANANSGSNCVATPYAVLGIQYRSAISRHLIASLPDPAGGCQAITAADCGEIALNEWHHAAVVYDHASTRIGCFLDGLLVDRRNADTTGITWNDRARIGEAHNLPRFRGAVDEVRVSRNLRYAANSYTVPTAPFTPDADTAVLLHLDEAGNFPGHTNEVFDHATGAWRVSRETPRYATGLTGIDRDDGEDGPLPSVFPGRRGLLVERGVTNVVVNGGFEAGQAGWNDGTALTVSPVTQETRMGGGAMVLVVSSVGAALEDRLFTTVLGLPADEAVPTQIALSAFVYDRVRAAAGLQPNDIQFAMGSSTIAPLFTPAGRGWFRMYAKVPYNGDNVVGFYLSGNASRRHIVDGLQVEPGGVVSTYSESSFSLGPPMNPEGRVATVLDYPGITPLPEGTLAAWIQPTFSSNTRSGERMTIFDLEGLASLRISDLATGGSEWRVNDGAPALLTRAAGTWIHVAVTWDVTGAVAYVDGTLVATGPALTPPSGSNSVTMHLGHDHGGTPDQFADSVYADVQLYDRALTQAELGTLMTGF